MHNKRYKKLQHKINYAIRAINENIANDDLWRGRFYAQQKEIHFYTYEDKSGVIAVVKIAFIDKQTGVKYIDWMRDLEITGVFSSRVGHKLWQKMNDFVCNATKHLNHKEYRNIAIDYTNDKRWSK